MPKMDRRVFLQGTGMLTAGALTLKVDGRSLALEMAAPGQAASRDREMKPSLEPVYEPFEWTAPGNGVFL